MSAHEVPCLLAHRMVGLNETLLPGPPIGTSFLTVKNPSGGIACFSQVPQVGDHISIFLKVLASSARACSHFASESPANESIPYFSTMSFLVGDAVVCRTLMPGFPLLFPRYCDKVALIPENTESRHVTSGNFGRGLPFILAAC